MKIVVVGIIVILVMTQLASTSTILMLRSENSALRNKLDKYESFIVGGTYRLKVDDPAGKQLYNGRVRVPQVTSCYADDLIRDT